MRAKVSQTGCPRSRPCPCVAILPSCNPSRAAHMNLNHLFAQANGTSAGCTAWFVPGLRLEFGDMMATWNGDMKLGRHGDMTCRVTWRHETRETWNGDMASRATWRHDGDMTCRATWRHDIQGDMATWNGDMATWHLGRHGDAVGGWEGVLNRNAAWKCVHRLGRLLPSSVSPFHQEHVTMISHT